MTKTKLSMFTVIMVMCAVMVIPNAHALVVTPDGFTQSSGHSRYTALSSASGRVCGLELCNLVVPNLKSSTAITGVNFEKVEGKELSREQILEMMIGGDFAKAILANYNDHKSKDIGMLVDNSDNTLLFANPDFVNPKPTITTLQRNNTGTLDFTVVLPDYIARYTPGYANEEFPVYKPNNTPILNETLIMEGNLTEMVVVNGTTVELIEMIEIQDSITQTNSTETVEPFSERATVTTTNSTTIP